MPPKTRLLKFVAVVSLLIGAGCLAICVKFYIKGSFLQAGAPIDPTPTMIEALRQMIRSGYFGIIPGMAIFLFLNSFLMWSAAKRFDSDKQDKT
jgi:hypothetical protein